MTMKTLYKHLAPALVASSLLILAACQGSSQDVESRIAKVGQKEGSGVLAKVKADNELQALKIDPTTLEIYKTSLKSIFYTLGEGSESSWEKLFKLKNWYMGPAKAVAKIPAPISGTLDELGSDYVIQQSEGDVFIDKELFEKLKDEKKTEGLLVEFLKSLYTIRSATDAELCQIMKETFEATCPESAKVLEGDTEELADGAKKADSLKKTNFNQVISQQADAKIKAVAQLILKQGASVKAKEVLELMKTNGFNMKIFDYKLELEANETQSVESSSGSDDPDAKPEKLEVSKELFHTLIPQIQAATTHPLKCLFSVEDQKEAVPCSLSLSDKSGGNTQLAQFGVNLKFEDKQIESTSIFSTTAAAVSYKEYVTSEEAYAVFFVYNSKLLDPTVDVQYRSTFLLAKRTLVNGVAGLELVAMISVPGTITKVSEDKKSCEGKVDMDGSLEKLAYIVHMRDGVSVEQSIFPLLPSMPPCW